MDALRYQRPHSSVLNSLLMWHHGCRASRLQKVISSPSYNSLKLLAVSNHNKEVAIGCDTSTVGKAVFCELITTHTHGEAASSRVNHEAEAG